METIKRIILTLLAVVFGFFFTCSFTLAFVYHDIHLGIRYALIGFCVLCLYFIVWFRNNIYHYFKNRKQI